MTGPWLGVVADDLTGACDLADAVSEAGGSAVVVVGHPTAPPPACDCVVVALKSRTAPGDQAVAESLAAARWLLDAGCTTLYQKYCSTFDSTDEGNIGPVADALADLVGGADTIAVGTPATPRVGRTVYQGHLFVGRRLLSESPLRDHPLTPMRDPDLVRVLSRQAEGRVALVDWGTVAAGPAAVTAAVESARRDGARHVIVDALADGDLDTLATALLATPGSERLVGGAAGLAAALARVSNTAAGSPAAGAGPGGVVAARAVPVVPEGRRLILSGSCSARTREQVDGFSGPRVTLSPVDLDTGFPATVDAVAAAVARAYRDTAGPVLVTSSADPEQVARYESRLGPGRAAALLEAATAHIARRAVDTLGVRRLLVAGGETSGAVVRALGLGTLRVGPAAGPGLPWMVPEGGPALALLLKSGNFGDPDLFDTAWRCCP
ncbi:3-oxo-tetronate kinase [Micromonospora sp. NPDC023644]|uniref:3-oxo-tetronate kinase n=1 Tax=Micromonospora sp. NPDC023644 TaxID=3154321 RepID=UPI0033F98819